MFHAEEKTRSARTEVQGMLRAAFPEEHAQDDGLKHGKSQDFHRTYNYFSHILHIQMFIFVNLAIQLYIFFPIRTIFEY